MTEPPLRLTQRDDGDGVRAHARLTVQGSVPNTPSSQQAAAAPRVGNTGRYA